MTPGIDHLVVGAARLGQGRRYVEDLLGVAMTPGGTHPQMGTHNCLLGLGPSAYLEVIAIDPQAPPPGRPRWFGLDHPATASRLARGPGLLTWVVHGVNQVDLPPSLRDRLGPVETMRRGGLEWQITIPRDGRPPADGALPALIAWATPEHPARGLPDRGCRLAKLHLHHPHAKRISQEFQWLGVSELSAEATHDADDSTRPILVADIQTPQGLQPITS